MILYRPVRESTCPLIMLLTMKPIIIGVITAPAFVALDPITPCTKSGRYEIAPNMPIAVRKVAIIETVKMRFLKMPRLRTGSFGAALHEEEDAEHDDRDGDHADDLRASAHAYWLPPSEKASRSGMDHALSAATPR